MVEEKDRHPGVEITVALFLPSSLGGLSASTPRPSRSRQLICSHECALTHSIFCWRLMLRLRAARRCLPLLVLLARPPAFPPPATTRCPPPYLRLSCVLGAGLSHSTRTALADDVVAQGGPGSDPVPAFLRATPTRHHAIARRPCRTPCPPRAAPRGLQRVRHDAGASVPVLRAPTRLAPCSISPSAALRVAGRRLCLFSSFKLSSIPTSLPRPSSLFPPPNPCKASC